LSTADAASARAQLERALFADSLIVQTKPDSVIIPGSPHRGLFLVRGHIEQRDDRLKVCLSILNILQRPVVGPDTATIQPAQLDSVLLAFGHHAATALAERRSRPTDAPLCR